MRERDTDRDSKSVGNMVATLSAWPWEKVGPFKYLIYGVVFAKVIYSRMQKDIYISDSRQRITRNATWLVASAIVVGLCVLTHTLGTLVPVIGASGFVTATAEAATALGTVVGSFR
ncbi:hypothetical protein ACSBR1_032157 [Camellia fascicularis]